MPKNTPQRIIDGTKARYAGAVAAGIGGGSSIPDHGILPGLADDDHPQYLNQARGDLLYVPLIRQIIAGAGLDGGGNLVADPTLTVKVAAPVTLSGDNVTLSYSTGLTVSGGALVADIGAGLKISANKIVVDYGSTLALTGNVIGVNPAYAFAWTASHTWAEGQGLASAGTVIVPGLTPGYGWSITNAGGNAALSIPNIWVGSLHAQAFILDTARVDVGEEIWTRSRATLYASFTTPAVSGTASLIVEVPAGVDGSTVHLFGESHYVRLRVFDSAAGLTISDAWGQVAYASYTAGGSGLPARQTYTFTMRYGSVGATIPAGALAMGYGVAGDSFVLLTTLKPGSPYQEFLRWGIVAGAVDPTAVPWDNAKWKSLARVGNLSGITDSAFSASPLVGAGLWAENVYLKGALQLADTDSAVSTPVAAGLYAYGDKLGYWDTTWQMYMDNAGTFVFADDPTPTNGSTRLRYADGKLGGELYNTAFPPVYTNPPTNTIEDPIRSHWRSTWYADAADGVFYAGLTGEVMLHDYGVSLIGYTGDDITPAYNTKSLAFFDTTANAKTNEYYARSRIWGGWDVDPDAAGADANVKSMLQLEVGVGTEGRIDSDDRPHLALMYLPTQAASHTSRLARFGGWNSIELDASHDGAGTGSIFLSAQQVNISTELLASAIYPNNTGAKVIGSSGNKYEALYARTIYADTVIAPAFTGQNTVGCEVSVANLYHSEDRIVSWTEIRDDAGFYAGADSGSRLVADSTGWYYVTLSLTYASGGVTDIYIKVNATTEYFRSATSGGKGTVGGFVYLAASDYVQAFVVLGGGAVNINARMTMVRSGTMGAPTASYVWASAGQMYIQSNQGSNTQLVVENTHATATMSMRVEGGITSDAGTYNGVAIETLSSEWTTHKTSPSPHPQYMLRSEAQAAFATQEDLNSAVFGAGAEEYWHNSLLGLTTGDPHTQYVNVGVARTITAQHTFAPASTQAPFTLGTNAQGQLVPGFNADTLDGHHWSEVASTPAAILASLLTVDGAGSGVDADYLDGLQGAAYALAATAVTAGDGLSGGGTLASAFGIALATPGSLTATSTNTASGNHTHAIDATIARSAITISAGNGLSGGGDLTANRSLAVNQGYAFTWTGAHAFQNTITARHISPELTDTYDLGTSVYWWRQQFVSQINAAVFAESTVQLLGGWLMIPKDAGTLPAVTAVQTTIDFGKAMTPGNWIVVKAHDAGGNIKTEYMTIGSLVSGTTYNVTRDVASAHGTDPAWSDGTPYALLGGDGDGRIELNAFDTPRISMIVQGNAYNAQTEYIRLGDLNGMPGVSTTTWGLYIGDATQYLKYAGGALTIAGEIMVGTTNKMWFNQGSDGILAVGGTDKATAPFRVTAAGALTATSATITGAITATSGSITGGLTMGANGYITAGNARVDANGFYVAASTSYALADAYRFKYSSTTVGGLFAQRTTGAPAGAFVVASSNYDPTTNTAIDTVNARFDVRSYSNDVNNPGAIYLIGYNVANSTQAQVQVLSGQSGTASSVWLSAAGIYTDGTLYGSASANGDVAIEGTSHATKTSSYVLLQPDGGNVGIGTSSPQYKFDVVGGTAIIGTWGVTAQFTQDKTDYRGILLGYDTSGNISTIAANTNGPASTMTFWTYSGAAWAERLRLTHSALAYWGVNINVGSYVTLGAMSSGQGLVLGHNVRASLTEDNKMTIANTGYYGQAIRMYYDQGIAFHTVSTTQTAGADFPASTTERMRIAKDGNVGIGTTSPGVMLALAGGAIELTEMTAPSAGATNSVRLYAVDDGAGKTRLMVKFATGAAQVLAVQA